MEISKSNKIYFGLILILAILAAINVLLPQGDFLPSQQLPASKPVLALVNFLIMLILYGGLGFLGLKLSRKLGFADIWAPTVTNKQRFFIPAVIGIGTGGFFIIADIIFSQFHTQGPFPHPPFPTSLVTSAVAGIGEEVIFRLFFIPFWVWLISHVILKKKWKAQIFWITAVISAITFALGHMPTVMMLYDFNAISQIPVALIVEMLFLNGVVSMFAAYYFKKFGFLAAVGIHFWTDIVWHVIWGMI